MEFHHISILLEPCLDLLNIREQGVYIDATLGGAGHAAEILKRLSEQGTFLGIDRDRSAIEHGQERLKGAAARTILLHSDYRHIRKAAADAGVTGADGILFDLGVSSPQLDLPGRGFSYQHDARLDMRMDQTEALSAYEVVNDWSREEIRRILFEYGEERYAPLIAAGIERARAERPIETTGELVSIVRSSMPAAAKREKQHPAKRTFQAIRMAVNDELASLREAMDAAIVLLNPGGRMAVISFHSLEDRVVKTAFASAAKGCDCPSGFPICVCGKVPQGRVVTKKPIVPSDEEIKQNPRARSAKLRGFEKH